jgi:hypothetical protein
MVVNMRLPAESGKRLKRMASRHGWTASDASARLVEEGLRRSEFGADDLGILLELGEMPLVACHQVICTSTVSAFKEDVVRGVRSDLSYQSSLVIPETASKWRSRLRSGRECWRHNAAIQTSFEGMGVPAFLSSLRTAL